LKLNEETIDFKERLEKINQLVLSKVNHPTDILRVIGGLGVKQFRPSSVD
jgi:hypothetical protein